jgi:hypothetical protein
MINKELGATILAIGFLLSIGIVMGQDAKPLNQEAISPELKALDGITFGPQNASGEILWRLVSASDAISANLTKIETALMDASIALSETGIDGPNAKKVLSRLVLADPSVIDCITIDPTGSVREVEPSSFESIKGENLKVQEHINETLNTRLYSGFHLIKAIEGVYAIDSEMPVFDRNGAFIGTVSFLFNNSQFFENILSPIQPGGNSKIWVIKADDATILYDTDPSQILLNESSPVYQNYPELLEISERMSVERTGYGTYKFLDQSHGEAIKKGCYWTTIPNQGTQMRIVLTLEVQ